jgi:DNA-binding MarR family transcriptional regulator
MNPQLTILSILRDAHPRMMPCGPMWAEVRMQRETMTYTEYTTSLNSLEEKGQIVIVQGEDKRRAKITDAGIARLAENGL